MDERNIALIVGSIVFLACLIGLIRAIRLKSGRMAYSLWGICAALAVAAVIVYTIILPL